ncbi:MAG: diaminopimelate decarboxylase [Gammaproteobacteria bacterium]|nr:diaminopimelate decarboxylase [Gammaproteobacteria bacterium]
MDYFDYREDELFAEGVSLTQIAAHYGTPAYIYSRATLERHWSAFDAAFANVDHLICYAVKANSNIAILNLLARLGSGFDIVSVGELERVLAAGGDPAKVLFSGVGKRVDEIERALEVGIHCFNVESESELIRINEVALRMGLTAPISLRVNPNVDAGTHPYISTGLKENKFGVAIEDAEAIYVRAAEMKGVEVVGIDCHIGSQLTEISPFVDALEHVLELVDRLYDHGIALNHVDIGGGLGITYKDEKPPLPGDYAMPIVERFAGRDLKIIIEPGRAIAGNAGLLLTRVEYLKHNDSKAFAVVDAAMNDLLRPSLYSAWQDIVPVKRIDNEASRKYDVVGPICETGDFLGKDRKLNVNEGDLLAVRSAGAYGFSMSSNYNSRPRVAEVMVDGAKHQLIRERETVESLFQSEHLLPAE